MDIEAMIRRRQRPDEESRLVAGYEPLSPATHVEEPTDRGRLLEQLLDHLDPVFDSRLPPHGYLYGPKGAGKSAVVTALFARLDHQTVNPGTAIYTTTRVEPTRELRFVYVDTRRHTSEFGFYHTVVDAITDEPVPRHGISTDTLRTRLHRRLDASGAGLLLAVDHVGESGSAAAETLVERFSALPSSVSWLAVGRTEPDETVLTDYTAEAIRVGPYRHHVLVDVLLRRAADALNHAALDDDAAATIAAWADGDAHDALAALFVAADRAARAGHATITDADVDAGFDEVPADCVALGRVFALPANKQTVLRALLDLDPADRETVTVATAAIADETDLAAGTIKRYLYELAAVGVVDRMQTADDGDQGRPPSRLEPSFPPTVFRRLYDLEG
ncbi:Cdc6/Cdc18 family protein [Haloarcula onubensis]|uniref:AAA family ATPase n=1 Tax=Haloarcula onubensis TaxID=2950539 RepID=A0ABU2FKF4_9EURY|nr:AAA family ATPase [Halomicroarcula sp. S3CR25-11]MDS0281193.1 AAA family ATPase [Halomicroarcula sp. S3CR25-11]